MKILAVVVVAFVASTSGLLGSGGLLNSVTGVIDGVTGAINDVTGVVSGIVSGLNFGLTESLTALLGTFSSILSKLDVPGLLGKVIKSLTNDAANQFSNTLFFVDLRKSGSGGSSKNGSINFVVDFSIELEAIMERILNFTNIVDFDFEAVIVALKNLIFPLTVVFGEKIIGAVVHIFEQFQVLIRDLVKAVIGRDFQLIEKIAIKIICNFNVLIDLIAAVSVNVSVKGASNAATDALNVATALLCSVPNVLFTAVQTIAIAVQATIGQVDRGAGKVLQAEINAAQNVLGKLITNVEVVVRKITEFLTQGTAFIQGANSVAGDFSVKFNAIVSAFVRGFGVLVVQVTTNLSSVTGYVSSVVGQLSGSVFTSINIAVESFNYNKFVISSVVKDEFGLLGLVREHSSVGGSVSD